LKIPIVKGIWKHIIAGPIYIYDDDDDDNENDDDDDNEDDDNNNGNDLND
jgi:hypothetical protein